MIPKKILLFGLLVLAGVGFLLKDMRLSNLQSKDLQKELKRKEEARKITTSSPKGEGNTIGDASDNMSPEEKALAKEKQLATERGYRFIPGECISNRSDGWEFTKIVGLGEETYKIIDCHKYKGCTQQTEVSWRDLEFEYRAGKVIPCSR
jgi:hypothetical protein